MSTADDQQNRIDDEAANWMCERDEGFAPGRQEAFLDWLNRDPRHVAAFSDIERTWQALEEMPAVRGPLTERFPVPAKASHIAPASGGRHAWWQWAAGLAALVAVVFAGRWVLERQGTEIYALGDGAPQRIALEDGSIVDLNSHSELQVRFTPTERRLTLAAGEAHFQVAHNAARPFFVTANGMSVRAVGTAFRVRLAPDKLDLLVTEGKVEVGRAFFREEPAPQEKPVLVAGERAELQRENVAAAAIERVDAPTMHALLSWQDRVSNFTDVPLGELVARINRCNSTRITIEEPSLASRKIGGVIALNQVDAFLEMLKQDGDIRVEREGGEIRLRRAQ